MSRATTLAALLFGALGSTTPPVAHAQRAELGTDAEYGPLNEGWNGISEWLAMAAEAGIVVETPGELDIGSLSRTDSVVILFPTEPVPSTLGGFMAEGGRVAIADDFGRSESFLRAFGIRREPAAGPGLRGNPNLPVARPIAEHPLTEGVRALVTNHPATMHHPELSPIFRLPDATDAVVLAGTVGGGRLTVIGDPSLFINNMMQFRENRRFAMNLLTYLTSGQPSPRIVLMLPGSEIHGRFGALHADRPLERIRAALEQATGIELPGFLVSILTASLTSILLLFAASSVPRRSPYQPDVFLPDPERARGRMRLVRATPSGLGGDPALDYRRELLAETRRRLGLHPDTEASHVIQAVERSGVGRDPRGTRGLSLMRELDRRWRRAERARRVTSMAPSQLRSVVERGEAFLELLPEPDRASSRSLRTPA